VSGCRCDDCRGSHRAAYAQRQAAKLAAAPSVIPSGPPGEGILVRGGREHKVRTCPGAGGAPCIRSPAAWLRGQVICTACIERATVWNGNVPVGPVRAHLLRLRRAGVGRKSVAAACDVSATIIAEVLAGEKKTIRASTAKRILEVTRDAIADHALVPAGPTWRRIRSLLDEGYRRGDLARRLGCKTSALQLGRRRVLASTAMRVERLYKQLST
jgi:hypothetical protein